MKINVASTSKHTSEWTKFLPVQPLELRKQVFARKNPTLEWKQIKAKK